MSQSISAPSYTSALDPVRELHDENLAAAGAGSVGDGIPTVDEEERESLQGAAFDDDLASGHQVVLAAGVGRRLNGLDRVAGEADHVAGKAVVVALDQVL